MLSVVVPVSVLNQPMLTCTPEYSGVVDTLLSFGLVHSVKNQLFAAGLLTVVWWNKSDNEKLAKLWHTPHSGIDPKDLSVDAVKKVHENYFPQFKYPNFAPLYRDKARAWNVNKTLDGHRQSKLV